MRRLPSVQGLRTVLSGAVTAQAPSHLSHPPTSPKLQPIAPFVPTTQCAAISTIASATASPALATRSCCRIASAGPATVDAIILNFTFTTATACRIEPADPSCWFVRGVVP